MQVAQMSDFVADFSSCSDMSVLSHIVAHMQKTCHDVATRIPFSFFSS